MRLAIWGCKQNQAASHFLTWRIEHPRDGKREVVPSRVRGAACVLRLVQPAWLQGNQRELTHPLGPNSVPCKMTKDLLASFETLQIERAQQKMTSPILTLTHKPHETLSPSEVAAVGCRHSVVAGQAHLSSCARLVFRSWYTFSGFTGKPRLSPPVERIEEVGTNFFFCSLL